MVGAYKRLYINVESSSARSAAVSISRNLIALVQGSDLFLSFTLFYCQISILVNLKTFPLKIRSFLAAGKTAYLRATRQSGTDTHLFYISSLRFIASLSCFLFVYLSLNLFVYLTFFLCVSLSPCPFVSISLCLFVPKSFCLFGSLSLCLFTFFSLCFFVSLSLCPFVPLSHCPFVSLSFRLFVSLSLCLFISLSL